jgi:hypothetical protein
MIIELGQFLPPAFAMQNAEAGGSGPRGKRAAEGSSEGEPDAKRGLTAHKSIQVALRAMNIGEVRVQEIIALIYLRPLYKAFLIDGDQEAKDYLDSTPLHKTAWDDELEVAKLLLDRGAKVDALDQSGDTPLTKAVEYGRLKLVRLFLDRGADLNAARAHKSLDDLLRLAVGESTPEVAELLLDRGANVNSMDENGKTPLYWTAISDHPEATVKLLLDRGAQVNTPGVDGKTPLYHHAFHGNSESVKLLLDRGAQVDTPDVDGKTPLDAAKEGGEEWQETCGPSHEALLRFQNIIDLLEHQTAFHQRDAVALTSYIHQGKSIDLDLMQANLIHTAYDEDKMRTFLEALRAEANLKAAPAELEVTAVLKGTDQRYNAEAAKSKVIELVQSWILIQ